MQSTNSRYGSPYLATRHFSFTFHFHFRLCLLPCLWGYTQNSHRLFRTGAIPRIRGAGEVVTHAVAKFKNWPARKSEIRQTLLAC